MRILQHWLKSYMEYTKHLEAPDIFHFWAGVGTIAGALRGKVFIDMGYFKWKPNFFIIYVAPPGVVAKSTTIGVGMQLLREVEGIHFGPDSATWQALTKAFTDSTEEFTLPGGELEIMSAITITASELGTFLDPQNREMIDVLVDLWDGREIPWKRSTKGEGDFEIAHPWLNFIGCTTPAWIEGNFPEYAIGGGFTSRCVFVYGDSKRHLQAYPKQHMTPEFADLRKLLIQDLEDIAGIAGEYVLTEEATAWGEKWYKEHWETKHPHLRNDRFGGYIARKQTHIHKLAMIISAAQRSDMLVIPEDLQVAETFVTALEQNFDSVFQRITDSRDARYSVAILATLRQNPVMAKQTLWRELFSLMSHEQFEAGLEGMVRAGYATMKPKGNDIYVCLTPKGEKQPQSAAPAVETSAHSEAPQSADEPAAVVPLRSSQESKA